MTAYTMAMIRQEHTGTFFAPENMRFFSDTMKSFNVVNAGRVGDDGLVRFKRIKPMMDSKGRSMGGTGTVYRFDPRTGEIKTEKGG